MQGINSSSGNNKIIQDIVSQEKLEIFIQQKYNITIPSLIFEYLSEENIDFEINELKNFYSLFGEIIDFILKGKISIVLFKTFFSAERCRIYLLDNDNFKENKRNNFSIRWFDYDKDINIIPYENKKIFETFHNCNLINIKNVQDNNIQQNSKNINNTNKIQISTYNINNNINNNMNNNMNNIINNYNSNNIFMPQNIMIQQNNQLKMDQSMSMNTNNINNLSSNLQNFPNLNSQNYQNLQNMHPMQYYNGMENLIMHQGMNMPLILNQNINNINNINNIFAIQLSNQPYNNQKPYSSNLNISIEEKNYGKFTCKYEILIPNDKDFQVARRLIGSKGCNMKRILNECKQSNNINDNVKLRLRGKGSGYKEGPQNKESEGPLHLCISAKNQEEMKRACELVDSLLDKIYDEYKKYCSKNNIMPIATQLAKRIDCGNSLHKGK